MEPLRQDDGPLQADILDSEPLQDMEESTVSEMILNNSVTGREREEMHTELIKLEEEIATLKQVLASKERRQAELKNWLGVSPLSGLKQNLSRGWNDMQSTTAYKKTSETLSTVGQRTTVAFNNLGTVVTRKIEDMRNSSSFKSFEEKVESTVSNIKSKVGGSASGGSFEDVLSSTAQACAQEIPTNNLRDNIEFP